ncbi:MAG: fused DSP-PTPase phosphatase/NAD kinase-like protein [Thermoanaerobaculia bacterium]
MALKNMKKKNLSGLFASLAAAAILGLAAPLTAATAPSRPSNWANAVTGTHVQNLYRVEPDLLRSAQPDSIGFQDLAALGVKTVLDLRSGHADSEEAGKTVLRFLRVPMRAWSARDDQVVAALRILSDPSNRPILVHCQHGADRTGMILALYRVVVQNWTKEDALREMDQGGYHHSSFFRNLDRYVSRANIAALRKDLGITIPAVLPAPTASAESVPAAGGAASATLSAPSGPAIPQKLALHAPALIPLDASAASR